MLPKDVDTKMLARAVSNSVFGALVLAMNHPEREDYWRTYADRIEKKFSNQFGRHYSYFIGMNK
jgi:hypothetical protein